MDDYLKMLKYFPSVIPDATGRYWEGVFTTKDGKEIMVTISTPYYPSIKGMKIQPQELQVMLDKALNKMKDMKTFYLTEILLYIQKHKVASCLAGDLTKLTNLKALKHSTINLVERYNKILSELKTLEPCNISGVDENLTRLSLSVTDSSNYKHRIDVKLPENYPLSPPSVEYLDLPETVIKRISNCESLTEMYSSFVCVVGELQLFWRVYDGIREFSWVIDPAQPLKKDNYCRIAIDKSTSLIVTLNPSFPTNCPEVQFLGPDKDVLPLRTNLERNLKTNGWDETKFLTDNLADLLELDELPLAPCQNSLANSRTEGSSQLLVDSEECMICFALRSSDDLLPAKICNNDKCASLFHVSCLIQWLQSVPTNEPSFNLISGDCPHCGERILCPMKVS